MKIALLRVGWALICWGLLAPCILEANDANGKYKHRQPENEDSCGKFLSARDEARHGKYDHLNDYIEWLSGYLSGFNRGAQDTYDIAGDTDTRSMFQWIENRCRQRPQESFSDAVEELIVEELFSKRKRTSPKPESQQ
jgi:hypothetical protein